jgi:hypothetical protein
MFYCWLWIGHPFISSIQGLFYFILFNYKTVSAGPIERLTIPITFYKWGKIALFFSQSETSLLFGIAVSPSRQQGL